VGSETTPLPEGWLPIVSAPTDGTEFDLMLPNGSIWTGRFKWPEGHWQIGSAIPNARKIAGNCGLPDQVVPHTMMLWGRVKEGVFPTHWRPRLKEHAHG
jgi:hypothetical protein